MTDRAVPVAIQADVLHQDDEAMRTYAVDHPELGCSRCDSYPAIVPWCFLLDRETAKWTVNTCQINETGWAVIKILGTGQKVRLCPPCASAIPTKKEGDSE